MMPLPPAPAPDTAQLGIPGALDLNDIINWAAAVISLTIVLAAIFMGAKMALAMRALDYPPPTPRKPKPPSAVKAPPVVAVKVPPGVTTFQQLIANAAPEDREWFARQAALAGIELPPTANPGDKP